MIKYKVRLLIDGPKLFSDKLVTSEKTDYSVDYQAIKEKLK